LFSIYFTVYREINDQNSLLKSAFVKRCRILIKLSDVEKFARNLAIEAGGLIQGESNRGAVGQSFKNDHELVTDADIAADELICREISQMFPKHSIVSEESFPNTNDFDKKSTPFWVIDPIDGTVNYAHGHDQSAVSIAYCQGGHVEIGIVYNPFTNEMFSATRGNGAFLNGKAIRVADKRCVRRAIVATGFPYEKSNIEPMIQRVGAILRHCADIRRLGSAALDICWVAAGRLDVYYESLNLWDFAAARLIASEAGAVCGHFSELPQGEDPQFYENDLLITNAHLFPKIKEILQVADAPK
jgi:myo-inositol-1(or 4)-monophosphatase